MYLFLETWPSAEMLRRHDVKIFGSGQVIARLVVSFVLTSRTRGLKKVPIVYDNNIPNSEVARLPAVQSWLPRLEVSESWQTLYCYCTHPVSWFSWLMCKFSLWSQVIGSMNGMQPLVNIVFMIPSYIVASSRSVMSFFNISYRHYS